MNKLSVGECIKFGWETLKKRPLLIIGSFVLAMAISGIASSLLDPGEGAPVTLATVLMGIASAVIGLLVEVGLVTFSLRAHDNVAAAKIQDLWNPKPFLYYIAGQIIVGAIVVVGIVLLIVPGIIVALGFMFSSYLIIDKGHGPIEAMKESWQLTKGHKWELLLLVITIGGLNLLGIIALVVGLLVTVPVSMLAVVHAYRKLSGAVSVDVQTAQVSKDIKWLGPVMAIVGFVFAIAPIVISLIAYSTVPGLNEGQGGLGAVFLYAFFTVPVGGVIMLGGIAKIISDYLRNRK